MDEQKSRIPVVKVVLWMAERVLLLDRGRFWDLSGGHIAHGGEAVLTAAQREVRQETGIDRLYGLWHVVSAETSKPVPRIGDLRVHFCAACVPDGTDVVLSSEHGGFRWVDPLEAAEMLNTSYFDESETILAKLGLSSNPRGLEHRSTQALKLAMGDGGEEFLLDNGSYLVRRADNQWRRTNSNQRVQVSTEAEIHLFPNGNWVPWNYSAG